MNDKKGKQKELAKGLAKAAALIGAGLLLLPAAYWMAAKTDAAWDRREIGECQEWKKQSEEYAPHWFSTDWQRKQCEKHGIMLPR